MTLEHVSVSGIPELQAALEALDGKDRANTMRRAVRAASKPFAAAMSQVAAAEGAPGTFRKIPAAKVTTHGGRGPIEATVRPKTALFNILEPGAKPHEITPGSRGLNSARESRPNGTAAGMSFGVNLAGRPVLAGKSGSHGRHAAFFSSSAVRHPGITGLGIAARAFQMAEPAAMAAFTEVVAGAAAGKSEA